MSLRRLLQFRLPTLLIAVAAVCVLLAANTRPSQPLMLGHVSSDHPQIRPGLWVMGREFGWPLTWRVRPENHLPELLGNVFDEFHLTGLSANVAVGLLIVVGSMAASEFALSGLNRWRRNDRQGG